MQFGHERLDVSLSAVSSRPNCSSTGLTVEGLGPNGASWSKTAELLDAGLVAGKGRVWEG